jgi:hypothetical protein
MVNSLEKGRVKSFYEKNKNGESVNENGDENGLRVDILQSSTNLVTVLVNRNRVKTEVIMGETAYSDLTPLINRCL